MAIRIDGDNTTANPGITGADADTGLQFGTDEIQLVTGGTNRATVESNGNFTIEDGNLVVASGHGIDFSATANGTGTTTSELLDDYEEGTFTPVLQGGTTAGSYTPSSQLGLYTKIGRTVTVHLALVNITVNTNGTGSMVIAGLPFTSSSTNLSNFTGSVRMDRVDFTSPTKYVVAVMSQGQSRIGLHQVYDDSGDISITVTSGILQSGSSDIFVSISYIVD